jgi:hypothetical protein
MIRWATSEYALSWCIHRRPPPDVELDVVLNSYIGALQVDWLQISCQRKTTSKNSTRVMPDKFSEPYLLLAKLIQVEITGRLQNLINIS